MSSGTMSSVMSPYRYSSLLPGPDSIRLLRLGPPEDEAASIKCQLFNFTLDESDNRPPQYEALSYVWGDPEKTLHIFIDEHSFNVTENLHAALWHLRNRAIEWVWADAICINQQDQQERAHQVRYMAKIYGKANRVVVWLGGAADNSDRVFQEICERKEGLDSSENEIIQQAVLALLQRPWFRRIWVLQEVAAARHILIMCGLVGIEGYDFCAGLRSLQVFYKARPDLYSLIRSATYLIRQAKFRPTHGICWSDMSFLAIRPLGELLDMFHSHEATERHDKVYALLGMASDTLNAANLLPDYEVPWGEVFQRLVKFLLGEQVSVETWNHWEMAVIKSKGCILGRVSSVVPHSGWDDVHKVDIISTNASNYVENTREWTARLTLHTSANPIRQGDLICLLPGAPKPIIIRICEHHVVVIMIAATPPGSLRTESGHIGWAALLQSMKFSWHDFRLVWDWTKLLGKLHDREERETLVETNSGVPEHSTAVLEDHLAKATKIWSMALMLEDLEEYNEAEERFQEAIESCERAFGMECSHMPTSMNKHIQIAEEVVVQIAGLFDEKVMALLLERRGNDVMALLLERRGNDVEITESVVKAVIENWSSGKEIMTLLLERRGNDIQITERMVKAAVGKRSGKAVMMALIKWIREDVQSEVVGSSSLVDCTYLAGSLSCCVVLGSALPQYAKNQVRMVATPAFQL
ncbi:heterokaryon incompatibility protein-domain-containing protein, partial [Leptodontidium sp. 2 PMI_412]